MPTRGGPHPPAAGPDAYALTAHRLLNKVAAALHHSRRLHSELAPAGHPASATAELIAANLRVAISALEDLARGIVGGAGEAAA